MGAIRLLAIAVLVYLAYRVIKNLQREKTASAPAQKGKMPTKADVLEEDPVCGKLVPRNQAISYEKDGKKFYFCSKTCCEIFQKNQGEHQS